jgi:hypothetical protein
VVSEARSEPWADIASDKAWDDFARGEIRQRRSNLIVVCALVLLCAAFWVASFALSGRGSGSTAPQAAGTSSSIPWPHTPCSGRTPAQISRLLGLPIAAGELPQIPTLNGDANTQQGLWLQFSGNSYGARSWVEWRPARNLVSLAFVQRGRVLVLWTARFRSTGYSYSDGGCRGSSIQP